MFHSDAATHYRVREELSAQELPDQIETIANVSQGFDI
jgi:hypothetical protein